MRSLQKVVNWRTTSSNAVYSGGGLVTPGKQAPAIAWLILVITSLLTPHTGANTGTSTDTATIAFGSCLRQWQAQPVWQGVQSIRPDLFLFLGDNVYTDVGRYANMKQPERIGRAYRELADSSEFAHFRRWAKTNGTAFFATWDDHDYGINNGGREYLYRAESKKYFQQFFQSAELIETAGIGADDPGVYHSAHFELAGLRVQLILLDLRSFRTQLIYGEPTAACKKPILPATDPAADLLGEQQWQWLAKQLRQPADLRLLASGIQVLPTQHCYEKWANFPLQRQRLLDLIRDSGANGVVLVSGDRHLAEISRLPAQRVGYPVYEITASGLNSAVGMVGRFKQEPNQLRHFDSNVTVDNFGSITLQQNQHADPESFEVRLRLHDKSGAILQQLPVFYPLPRQETSAR